MLFLVAEIAVVAVGTVRPTRAQAAQAPPGAGFNVTVGDLSFILKQINIAEHHAGVQIVRPSPTHPAPSNVCEGLVGPGPNQVPDRLTPYGLRTVGGECNNLFPAGDVGPVAGATPAAAARALAAELARSEGPVRVRIPGSARELVAVALDAGLRLDPVPGLVLLSPGVEPQHALAPSGYMLF